MNIDEFGAQVAKTKHLLLERKEVTDEMLRTLTGGLASILIHQRPEEARALANHLGPLLQVVDARGTPRHAGWVRCLAILAGLHAYALLPLERLRWLHPEHPKGKLIRAVWAVHAHEDKGVDALTLFERFGSDTGKHLDELSEHGLITTVPFRKDEETCTQYVYLSRATHQYLADYEAQLPIP